MHVRVRLFAIQRLQAGKRSHELELPAGADVTAAWAALVEDLPALEAPLSSVRFARNGRYVDENEVLADGDELAVIPPVAGGADPESAAAASAGEPYRRLEISTGTLDEGLLAELRASVATNADGAVVVFAGQTRETPGTPAPGQEADAARFTGQRVEGLSYEAFEPMALAVLGDIAAEIEARFGVHRLAVVHRVGEVGLGETSVLIAVAAPHRGQAFDACRYAIEELKARVPIWKAERFTDGSVWMGAPPRRGPDEEPSAG